MNFSFAQYFLGFPPPEMAESSRSYFGTANTWGGNSKSLLKQSQRLLQIERSNTDATIVFVSDCWLDNGEVIFSPLTFVQMLTKALLNVWLFLFVWKKFFFLITSRYWKN